MSGHHHTQITEVLMHSAAQFFTRESNGTSLITITRAEASPDLKRATIFLSVLPESAESDALNFAKRNATELRTFMREQGLRQPPFLDIVIDYGEKNRQEVDRRTLR